MQLRKRLLTLSFGLLACLIFGNSSNAMELKDGEELQNIKLNQKIAIFKDEDMKDKKVDIEKDTLIMVTEVKGSKVKIKYDDDFYFANRKDVEKEDDKEKASEDTSEVSSEVDNIEIKETNIERGNITNAGVYSDIAFSIGDINKNPISENENNQKLNSLFTAYYPENSLMEGGFYDALGRRLNPSENTIAAPKEIPFGSQVQVQGTGTHLDGVVFTVRDRGGAIKKIGNQYHFDLLMPNRLSANMWGKRYGYVRIVRWGW